jgi:hypothetical protein
VSRRPFRTGIFAALATYGALAVSALGPAGAMAAGTGCEFPNSQYQHVIYAQFDNTHLLRDNPNVPSDRSCVAVERFATPWPDRSGRCSTTPSSAAPRWTRRLPVP